MSYILLIILLLAGACSKGVVDQGGDFDLAAPETVFTIKDKSQLIGGPLAQGRVGDILLDNDKISVIIQQPSKFAQSCPFGGVIIDADVKRGDGKPGQDNFGKMCPLVNVEWTVNYYTFQVLSDGSNGGTKKVRAIGAIDVLDYLDLDFVAPVAKELTGQTMYYSPRFDDAKDPFSTYEDLRGMNAQVTTDYTLDPGSNFVRIETTFENLGDADVKMPVGSFVNGSGQVQTLFPGLGFTPQPTAQITGDTVGIVYVPFEGVDVSYGYFYDMRQFTKDEDTAVKAQGVLLGAKSVKDESVSKRLISTSLTYSGVTGVLLGEEFLKVMPLGGPNDVKINFTIPAHGTKSITEFFVVGDGNAGSVFNAALSAQKISTRKISGKVVDESGAVVPNATVVVQNENSMTVITYRTKNDGTFSGELSTGRDDFDKAFGSGKYRIFVEKSGYHKDGTNVAGTCDPAKLDVSIAGTSNILCSLGKSGTVQLSGGIVDADSGKKIPARLTIVGFDPSPDAHAGAAYATTHGAGAFEDTLMFERPWGVVDVKYINIKGKVGIDGDSSFKIEPGHYAFVFSRGVEYGLFVREIFVPAGETTVIDGIRLKRLIKTPGWISADFHLHSIASPDSGVSTDQRALASVAEGMDVLQSSDHDWLVDYGPVVKKLEGLGVISKDSVATKVGDEISPNHYGHMHVFPLEYDEDLIDGGALDWTYSPLDSADPSPDYVMSPRDIIDHYKTGKGSDGEKVLQINHISEQTTALPVVSSWITTTAYQGVSPLSSYIEPSAQRIKPKAGTVSIPIPFGQNDLVVADFTAVELSIGQELYDNTLRETGLPQWFNLLNLGILATATADSDSHREIVNQLGMPRNYIEFPVDPRDGMGSFSEIANDAYAHAINHHKVVISAGPFLSVSASGASGDVVGVGDVVGGKKVVMHIDVKSPSWAWFDTIEIYANTEPLPADDDGVSTFKGVASDPKSFFAPYHVPKFYYEPSEVFTLADGSLSNWVEKDGVITASLDVTLNVEEDTWVVVFVSGNQGTKGWRSLFPFVTKSVADPSKMSAPPKEWTLETLARDPHMVSSAWAFANPIFIDVDGDTDDDGNPFEAKYIRSGISPLAK